MRHGSKNLSELQGTLPQNWKLHRETNEGWSLFALVKDIDLDEFAFGIYVDIKLIRLGLDSFCLVNYEIVDIPRLMVYSGEGKVWHIFQKSQDSILFDKESLLYQDEVQMLLGSGALALSIHKENISLELCFDITAEGDFLESDPKGLLLGRRYFSYPYWLHFIHVPEMHCFGRLNVNDISMRVSGEGSFQRAWGQFPFRLAKFHAECFTLFMNNGDELPILTYPLANNMIFATVFEPEKPIRRFTMATLTAMDYIEINEWRFSKGWKLELPEYHDTPLYLISLVSEQYKLPVSHPFATVLNAEGDRLGYAFCSLAPGARNELKKIPLNIYR